MVNPAAELHALYSEWRASAAEGGKSLASIVQPGLQQGVPIFLKAARLLIEIDSLIDDLAARRFAVGLYRRQFPDWTTPLLGTNAGWTQTIGPDNIVVQPVLDQIEGFALFLQGKVLELTPHDAADLREILRRARVALEADVELDPSLRLYIHRLLAEMEAALDDEAVGAGFDWASSEERLWVAFQAAEGASEKHGGLWRDLWVSFTTNMVSTGVLQAGEVILREITK